MYHEKIDVTYYKYGMRLTSIEHVFKKNIVITQQSKVVLPFLNLSQYAFDKNCLGITQQVVHLILMYTI